MEWIVQVTCQQTNTLSYEVCSLQLGRDDSVPVVKFDYIDCPDSWHTYKKVCMRGCARKATHRSYMYIQYICNHVIR